MILKKLTIVNYRNIEQAELSFSPNVNCLVGANGQGKTNILDALYYMSFCRSSINPSDTQCIRHAADFFLLEGNYETDSGTQEHVFCGVRAGSPKRVERNGKRLRRISEHIGSLPLVMVSPADALLVSGGSEERRRFMDSVIAQYDADYLGRLIRYDKALRQRNAILRREDTAPDWEVVGVLEDIMSEEADGIFQGRRTFVEEFVPIFKDLYQQLCDNQAEATMVDVEYLSHISRGPLKPQLTVGREKERIVGYTLHGIHKDDLLLQLGGYPLNKEGSQGQTKTYVIAMKLAQFQFLKQRGRQQVPLLLLDDIFDRLDAGRVQRLVSYVAGDAFGQIFITDTNRQHLDEILTTTQHDYRLFTVNQGTVEVHSLQD